MGQHLWATCANRPCRRACLLPSNSPIQALEGCAQLSLAPPLLQAAQPPQPQTQKCCFGTDSSMWVTTQSASQGAQVPPSFTITQVPQAVPPIIHHSRAVQEALPTSVHKGMHCVGAAAVSSHVQVTPPEGCCSRNRCSKIYIEMETLLTALSAYLLENIPSESLSDMICKPNNFSKGAARKVEKSKPPLVLLGVPGAPLCAAVRVGGEGPEMGEGMGSWGGGLCCALAETSPAAWGEGRHMKAGLDLPCNDSCILIYRTSAKSKRRISAKRTPRAPAVKQGNKLETGLISS